MVTPSRLTDPLLSGWRARIPGLLPALFQNPVDHVEELCVSGVDAGQPLDVDAELVETGREGRPDDVHPAPVHALQAFPHDGVVPAHRLQLQPDLLVAGA